MNEHPVSGDISFQCLVNHLSVGIVFVNEDGILTFMNKGAENLLQVVAEGVVGKRIDMLPLRGHLYRVLSEDCHQPLEMSIEGKMVSVQTMAVHGEGLRGELTEIRDVSIERKEKRQREEAVAMMTHDLKSPLTVLMGYIQMTKDKLHERLDTQMLATVKEMERAARMILSMTEDILDSYRLELGLLNISKEWCSARDIVENCCHDMAHEASAQGLNLTFTSEGDIPMVEADSRQISRVFSNLLGNALKFTSSGGTVAVQIIQAADGLHISFADTGIGIAEKDLSRIFAKYYRTEGSAGYKGTGLGLTITKAIVEAHGGRIEVSSTAGKGSTFAVVLPLPSSP